jgi:hypothetical protein
MPVHLKPFCEEPGDALPISTEIPFNMASIIFAIFTVWWEALKTVINA